MFRSSQFDKSLEKATSQLLLEPDWDSILSICDCIRQEDIQGKYAVAAIKKKIASENPHVAMFSLQVLESCVKNCGETVHQEIATKEFMEFLKDQAKTRQDPVKGKVLELVQVWSHAFRNEPNYKIVQDTYNLMKLEGYSFPVLKEADAMFMAEKAPEWKEGDCCNRCRTKFGMVTRQHHCRSCGEVFCGKCSAKNSIIPRFGIEREVRVCDACFDQINKSAGPGSKKPEDDLPAEYLASPLSKQSQLPPQKSEQEIQEEEELQLAIALSQSEQESKEKERNRMKKNYGLYNTNTAKETRQPSPSPVPQPVSAPMVDATGDMDPELARYLNRNYWQQKSEDLKSQSPVTTPSAPVATTTEPKNTGQGRVMESYQNGESEGDQEQFLQALHSSLEIFVNRMKSNSQRGRSIANDSSVQSLMNVISNMHPQLMKYVQEQEDLRAHYETLQDKLAQLRDAREALDALREDHREKRRREQEELERQRQIQMAHKLEIMRQKKHELLEMQRQLALQRLQEQEREMQMRFEQQKQMTQMRQMQNFYPQMYGQMHGQMAQMPGLGTQQLTSMPGMPQNMPTQPLASHGPGQAFSPGSSLNSSPVHQLHQQGHGQYPQNMGQASMMQGLGSGGQGMPMQGNIAPGSVGPPGSSATVMSSQQMYQQNTGQTSYSQAGQYDTTHLASQPTSMQGQYNSGSMTGQSYQTNVQYNPVGSPPTTSMMGQSLGVGHSQQSLGAGQGPVGMAQGLAYSQSQMGPEYQPYNMQSVANAVPQYGGQGPPQQYMPGGNAHMGYQQDPNMQQGGQESGQQQQRPPHPRQGEGELISFD